LNFEGFYETLPQFDKVVDKKIGKRKLTITIAFDILTIINKVLSDGSSHRLELAQCFPA
jgi:hypothetical protein